MQLCIAIPYYGQAHANFFACVQELIRKPPCRMAMIHVVGDSLIPRARNTLTWKFLEETTADAMLMIDSDIIFSAGHVARLLSHDREKHPCIAGLYPKKAAKPNWVLNTFEEGPNHAGDDGLLKVKYAGTGFMMLTREVLLEIAERWPERKYLADSDEPGKRRYDYFPIGPRNLILPDCPAAEPGEERYLSEDWAICELVRELGYDVVVDTQVRLQHMGSINYPIAADDVVPQEALKDIRVGQAVRSHLQDVKVFTADANEETGGRARRLIDVDEMLLEINGPGAVQTAPEAPDTSEKVPPPPLETVEAEG